MSKSEFPDPFEAAREKNGLGQINDQDDPVIMLLCLKDVRKAAHKYQTFKSGAVPGRIVVPSEVNIRKTRQVPFEMDPPEHTAYRAVLEDWFRRPLAEAYTEQLGKQISKIIDNALQQDTVEVVEEFALVMQSQALTLLLNIPFEEAETWISWGTHVFRSEGVALDEEKANILYDYIDAQIENSIAEPGEDLYSVLLATEVNGKKMTKEEVRGVMILTFAGGRDTLINAITNSVAYFAEHPESLARLREEPEIVAKSVEELIRYFAPLTQMGRVVTQDTEVCAHAVKADARISLCWASANRDARTFEHPNKIILDRKMNPHVSFGFSHHNCLGATHARQLLRTLLTTLASKVRAIDILDHKDNIEELGEFRRKVGFDSLTVRFNPIPIK